MSNQTPTPSGLYRPTHGDYPGEVPQEEYHFKYPVTHGLWAAGKSGAPFTPAAICDFGLDTPALRTVMRLAIRGGQVTPRELDEALGNAEQITRLLRRVHDDVHVAPTPYDFMEGRATDKETDDV